MVKNTVIIVAGGTGSRMKAEVPKQFLIFAGEAVIIHTLKNIKKSLPQADYIIVIGEGQKSFYEGYKKSKPDLFQNVQLVTGGDTRFQSVKNGLTVVASDGITLIHDAARPFVTSRLIKEGISLAGDLGNAIPVEKINVSLRKTTGNQNMAVDRSAYRSVQTPQFFGTAEIQKAYAVDYQDTFTDDAAVFEAAGHHIHLFDGDPFNFKITNPVDLAFAEVIADKFYSPK